MALPKFLQPYLASYDLKRLDVDEDKKLIITELLNKGDNLALDWISQNYSKEEIKSAVLNPIRGFWLKNVLHYWLFIFSIRMSKQNINKAVINLEV